MTKYQIRMELYFERGDSMGQRDIQAREMITEEFLRAVIRVDT